MRLSIAYLLLASAAFGQTFKVSGDVPAPGTFALADLQKLPRSQVVVDSRGVSVKYDGVSLVDLLKAAGLVFDEATKARNLHRFCTVTGSDGYSVVFAIEEFDPGLTDKTAILADTKDGKPLSSAEGPLHLIVSGEKRPMRSVRLATSLDVVAVTPESALIK